MASRRASSITTCGKRRTRYCKATQTELPIYAREAYVLGLAYRLALSWAPTQVPILKPLADEAYAVFAKQNVETESFYISPVVIGILAAMSIPE